MNKFYLKFSRKMILSVFFQNNWKILMGGGIVEWVALHSSCFQNITIVLKIIKIKYMFVAVLGMLFGVEVLAAPGFASDSTFLLIWTLWSNRWWFNHSAHWCPLGGELDGDPGSGTSSSSAVCCCGYVRNESMDGKLNYISVSFPVQPLPQWVRMKIQ